MMAVIGVTWFLLVAGLEVYSTPWMRRSTVRRWRRRGVIAASEVAQ